MRYGDFMHATMHSNTRFAFTLLELLVVIAIVGILAAMLVPAVTDRGCGDRTTACRNNLRQINVALILHLSDHHDQYPWQISTNKGGTEELIGRGIAADHFLKLTNYLKQSSLLLCPFEPVRPAADSFTHFSNSNLSYFLALVAFDAITNRPHQRILAGDRHLSAGAGQPVRSGLVQVSNSTILGWTPELHVVKESKPQGNLAFADGHVETVQATALPGVFQQQLLDTHRLVIP